MKSENTAIGILTITAILLGVALFFVPRTSKAEVSIQGGDYLVCTYPGTQAGDNLYIADTRTGVLAVFVFDNTTRSLQVKAMRKIEDGFTVRGGGR